MFTYPPEAAVIDAQNRRHVQLLNGNRNRFPLIVGKMSQASTVAENGKRFISSARGLESDLGRIGARCCARVRTSTAPFSPRKPWNERRRNGADSTKSRAWRTRVLAIVRRPTIRERARNAIEEFLAIRHEVLAIFSQRLRSLCHPLLVR